MDVLKTLKSYRAALMEIDVIQLQIDHLQTIGAPRGIHSTAPKLERVPDECLTAAERKAGSPVYVPAPRGTNNPEGKRMQEVGELERRLAEARERSSTIIRDFERLMSALPNSDERLVIRFLYMEGKTPAETASILDQSRASIYRKSKKAIRTLRKQFDESA